MPQPQPHSLLLHLHLPKPKILTPVFIPSAQEHIRSRREHGKHNSTLVHRQRQVQGALELPLLDGRCSDSPVKQEMRPVELEVRASAHQENKGANACIYQKLNERNRKRVAVKKLHDRGWQRTFNPLEAGACRRVSNSSAQRCWDIVSNTDKLRNTDNYLVQNQHHNSRPTHPPPLLAALLPSSPRRTGLHNLWNASWPSNGASGVPKHLDLCECVSLAGNGAQLQLRYFNEELTYN